MKAGDGYTHKDSHVLRTAGEAIAAGHQVVVITSVTRLDAGSGRRFPMVMTSVNPHALPERCCIGHEALPGWIVPWITENNRYIFVRETR